MLALMIYCYANGIFSSRRIERATHRDIGVRFVAANRHPDHDTIARFRRENFAAVSESFLQVLLLAKELKLLRVGLVSVDGSKFKANANKHRSVNRHPDHDTIARFRRENFAAVSESFLQVLLLAKELKLLRVGLVSVDGSKFKANASKHRSVI